MPDNTTVLIVEDDAGARVGLAELLRAEGFVVSEAGDIAGARKALRQLPIDGMLLDLKMPEERPDAARRALDRADLAADDRHDGLW